MAVDFSQVGQANLNVATTSAANREASLEIAEAERQNNGITAAQSVQTPANENSADADTETSEFTEGELATAAQEVQEFLQATQRNLNFSFDEDAERSVVRVTDAESGETIRQIPSEEVLQLAERIRDLQTDVGAAVGILFNNQA